MGRRTAVLTGTLALTVLAVLLVRPLSRAGPSPAVLRAQAIEIVDAGGQRRITLDAFGGRPAVWLYDGANRRRIAIRLAEGDVPEIVLADQAGRPRLSLRVGAERAAELRLTDDTGRPRFRISVDYENNPGLWMYDGLARARVGLKVTRGDPRLWLFEHPSGRVTFAAP